MNGTVYANPIELLCVNSERNLIYKSDVIPREKIPLLSSYPNLTICYTDLWYYTACLTSPCQNGSINQCENGSPARYDYIGLGPIPSIFSITAGVLMPILGIAGILSIIAAVARRSYFPMKGRSLFNILGQVVVMNVFVMVLILQVRAETI